MCKYIFTPIAHRGGSEIAYENTFQAFTDAYDLGYRWLETDVQISKDGVLYAIHDDNLKNITGKNVKIHDLNSDDLDQILIKGKYNIPRLEKLLLKFSDATFNLDSKNINSAKALVTLINREKFFKNLCLGSFSHKTLQYIRKSLKRDLPTTFSQMEVFSLLVDIKLDKLPRCRANYLQIPKSYFGYNLVSKKLLDFCKKNEIKVHIWTINESNEMKNLIGMGVDGIMTDKCRALLEALKSRDFIDRKIILEPFLTA
ncbi:glycerophosphodiester phosphodiesterase family protein [Paracoccaceae bacterium]|nr:glycerophosphodiester phosphodiesterase family protein [Paracoccaceae bacterium]